MGATARFVLAGMLLCVAAAAERIPFTRFDQNHSTVGFSVPILGGVSEVQGKFGEFTISVLYEEEDATRSSVDAVIAVASIDTGIDDRDAHLRTADFFDASRHPEIRFTSSGIVERQGGFVAVGDLVMHGIKRRIELPFTLSGPHAQPDSGGLILGVTADLTLNRQDYGVSWRHDIPAFVGDEVTVRIRLISRLTERPSTAPPPDEP